MFIILQVTKVVYVKSTLMNVFTIILASMAVAKTHLAVIIANVKRSRIAAKIVIVKIPAKW